MRVVLTNFGTTGDVYPFVALALEMAKHGHEPVLAFSPDFNSWIESFGQKNHPIGVDLSQAEREACQAMVLNPNMYNSVEGVRSVGETLAAALPVVFNDLHEVCQDGDVLISGPLQPAARMIHELTGIPFVSIHLIYVRDSETGLGSRGTGSYRQATAELINPFRQQLGLPALADPLTSGANSPQLALHAMSRHVSPPPRSWPAHYQMTGYFFIEQSEWRPESGLAEFMAKGDSPVVITFGSMPHVDPARLTEVVLEAIAQVGCRAVLQHGWSGLARQHELPPSILAVDYTSHEWLFSRAACVVHHGGAGTAAAVFRAGVPSVFVPHAGTQPIRASIAEGLGCAGPTVSYAELNAERLAAAIGQTLRCGSYAQAAAVLGEKIRSEPGVRLARQSIEQLVASLGRLESSAAAKLDDEAERERLQKVDRRKSYQTRQRSRRSTLAAGRQ